MLYSKQINENNDMFRFLVKHIRNVIRKSIVSFLLDTLQAKFMKIRVTININNVVVNLMQKLKRSTLCTRSRGEKGYKGYKKKKRLSEKKRDKSNLIDKKFFCALLDRGCIMYHGRRKDPPLTLHVFSYEVSSLEVVSFFEDQFHNEKKFFFSDVGKKMCVL
ncbi:hypothetical protein GLOIN_2v1838983 [Rhizophagus irregularis DAOM 181602=DAOM 197198]|uniref:Uncharacterized protein n=1 Tax=Rhizophagus irregularis (strain DAOM 181602 / DAOM 197198 / MUCL 43194) TaxID=747089 RepID=A0A2P4QBR8_RHIID|nr:hypothetical protein GLOIN_2v1838983 [Rhizophagus irregularis DAOM 181602=DAOM 197198]POG75079.1 hypothetical protein GLOIN_2v1838983 [Rhizophagus irregularis DAOM 181602=DAOM 197198]GET51177.1 hypothetical protein GLOIN_2v1838983 [Rhizophagus irregularis DAOM 181602=DAOM 197198]|eukprot:XP_025181945.1 hypothetical protein GLOIN_2v1838983 [Rhizophagus irregularis DAOM 181602=DAOM 197198]